MSGGSRPPYRCSSVRIILILASWRQAVNNRETKNMGASVVKDFLLQIKFYSIKL